MSKNELRMIRKIAFRVGFGLELGKTLGRVIVLSICKGSIKVLDDAVEKAKQKTEEAEKDIQEGQKAEESELSGEWFEQVVSENEESEANG